MGRKAAQEGKMCLQELPCVGELAFCSLLMFLCLEGEVRRVCVGGGRKGGTGGVRRQT